MTRSTSRSRISSTARPYASCTSTSRWLRLVSGSSFAYLVYPRCVSEMWAILTIPILLSRSTYFTHRREILGECQESRFLTGVKTFHGNKSLPEQIGRLRHRTVAPAVPDHLRRCSSYKTALMKVCVFGDYGVTVFSGIGPNLGVARCGHVQVSDVRTFREYVGQKANEARREVLVEKKPQREG